MTLVWLVERLLAKAALLANLLLFLLHMVSGA
jgi:hypothetical protein